METCRPLKSTETIGRNGVINIDLRTAGSYTIKVVDTDTNQVIVAGKTITAAGLTQIEPDSGKKIRS